MAWQALLDGAERERALAVVEAIADEIDRRASDDPTLADGEAGIALVHGYRARAGYDDGADRAFTALEHTLANLQAIPRPWLFRGTSGVGFVLHHLADEIGETDDVLAELDALARDTLALADLPRWDLTDGAIGLGVYGLERRLPDIIGGAARHVVARAEPRADGFAWTAQLRQPQHPEGHTNLGIAHGVAGAIAFLAEAGGPDAERVARQAVRHLRGCERADAVPRYPMYYGAITREFTGVLDGWCYGDASTALVLVRAGHMLGEPEWIAAGHALAQLAARRSDADLAHVAIDTTLCHGAISHAHIYNRLAQHLDDDGLRAAARRWYTRALTADLIASTPEPGLQLGLAGIALALLAAVSDIEPAWDRALLLSLPVG